MQNTHATPKWQFLPFLGPLLGLPFITLTVLAFTCLWLSRPVELYRALDENAPIGVDQVRQDAVVYSPFGAPIFGPTLRRQQASQCALSIVLTLLAIGLALWLLAKVSGSRSYGIPERAALVVLVFAGVLQFVCVLIAVYFGEIVIQGLTSWIFPTAVLFLSASAGAAILQIPDEREVMRIAAEEARILPGIFLGRDSAPDLCQTLTSAMPSWRFEGCVLGARLQLAIHGGEQIVQDLPRSGPLLELPLPLLPMLSRGEFVAWLSTVLPSPVEFEADQQLRDDFLRLQSSGWAVILNARGQGWATASFIPFRPAAQARLWFSARGCSRTTDGGPPLFTYDPPLPAAHAILKARLLADLPFALAAQSESLCEEFAARVRLEPRRWRAWLAQPPGSASALAELRWVRRLQESEEFEFEPRDPASALIPGFERLDQELTRELRPNL